MLDDALYFVEVIQAGSFSRAAQSLGMSKSQLSRNVSRLERKLATQLIHRTTRHLALTEAGREFYLSCQRIQCLYDEACEQLAAHNQELAGRLKMSAPIALSRVLLLPKINQFLIANPGIQIALNLSDKIEPMPKSHLDIAFRLSHSLADSTLHAKKIRDIEYCLCASPSYLAKFPALDSPQDLTRHKIIGLSDAMVSDWRFANGLKLTLNAVFAINDYNAHIEAALAGVGVIKVPRILAAPYLKQGQIREVLTSMPLQTDTLWAIYAGKEHAPLRLRAFLDFVG